MRMVCADVFLRALLRFSSGAASPPAFLAGGLPRRRWRRGSRFELFQVFCTQLTLHIPFGTLPADYILSFSKEGSVTDIIIAIDQKNWDEADARKLELLAELELIWGAKLGLQMWTAFSRTGRSAAWEALDAIFDCGIDWMGDFKFHDIGNTVGGAAANVARFKMDPDIVTVHASGSREMLRRAVAELPASLVAAVTVLTDISDEEHLAEYGVPRLPRVLSLAEKAAEERCHAIVCSPREVAHLAQHQLEVVRALYRIVPGTRLGSEHHDQKNVTTPAEAVKNGANALVIGREIWGAEDPVAAAIKIHEHLEKETV